MSPLERLQTDVETYLLSCTSDGDAEAVRIECAAIARVRPRTAEEAAGVQTKLQRLLAGLEGRNGLRGISLIIGMPEIRRVEPNVRALRGEVTLSIRVVEHLMINMGADGCRQGAEAFALSVAELLNHQVLTPWSPLRLTGIRPDPEAVLDKMVAYDVQMTTDLCAAAKPKVATPSLSQAGAVITLACSTAGAAIHYTTDGSYPGTSATLYSAPLTLVPGTHTLRCAAWLAGHAGSIPVEQTVTVPGD